jgi:ribosomal protein S18 acetylase RimI-like enzyme
MTELSSFTRKHLEGALALFAAEDWQTYTADPECTYRALAAPGSTTFVALDQTKVVALVQLQSDGEIQAHLSALVVAEGWRRRGIARRLLGEALHTAGGLRIDLITRSDRFYLGLGARQIPGFRLTRECLGLDGNATPSTSRPVLQGDQLSS